METEIKVRSERKEDFHSISDVIKSAFKNHPHSNQKEHFLVDELREQSALTVSLVAEVGNIVVGHIAFSEVTIQGKKVDWYGLAPVSVLPEFQSKGAGSKLIIEGLRSIKDLGANGCVLLGEPEYYGRFGFQNHENLILENVPHEYFLGLSFQGELPEGRVQYHEAFQKFG